MWQNEWPDIKNLIWKFATEEVGWHKEQTRLLFKWSWLPAPESFTISTADAWYHLQHIASLLCYFVVCVVVYIKIRRVKRLYIAHNSLCTTAALIRYSSLWRSRSYLNHFCTSQEIFDLQRKRKLRATRVCISLVLSNLIRAKVPFHVRLINLFIFQYIVNIVF